MSDRATIEICEARAHALQRVIDRCTAHIREGQQLRPDDPDAGLEALVVGWVRYHSDCCNFKARAERAEAENQKLRRIARLAASVMATLQEHGSGIVGHLLDTDDNDGQRLREALRDA